MTDLTDKQLDALEAWRERSHTGTMAGPAYLLLPDLIASARELRRLRCFLREGECCHCDPEVDHICRRCHALGTLPPCQHESERDHARAVLSDHLREADVVPAQELRDLRDEFESAVSGRGRPGLLTEQMSALLPEHRDPAKHAKTAAAELAKLRSWVSELALHVSALSPWAKRQLEDMAAGRDPEELAEFVRRRDEQEPSSEMM